jgi:hypothetical protein
MAIVTEVYSSANDARINEDVPLLPAVGCRTYAAVPVQATLEVAELRSLVM